MQAEVLGFLAGALIATVTAPVGVSGAGALTRYRKHSHLAAPLTRQLVLGALPGVIIGAVIRVFAVPGRRVFHLIVAVFLFPSSAPYWPGAEYPSPKLRPQHSP